ncbi:MAG: SRPBCC family protein [Deltaproteobacteria bacterium]|nr:SRPBCC family protein [bacterium]MCB9477550.1 SRPBCC family protein [Deltaproteobacteria bacterium]MCB9487619.1 SRPBCC family protein [Deltaproteobacteria bacterium]
MTHADPPPRPNFTTEERERLNEGKPLLREERYDDAKGQRAGQGVGYIHINAAPKKIWDVILDFNRYAEFYPNLKESKLTAHEENHYDVYFVLSVIGLLKLRYNINHEYLPDQDRMTWKMDQTKKNDFKETVGFWQVWPDGDGSLVCYSVVIETGRGVPKWAENFADSLGLTTWGLKKVVVSMKRRVEEGENFKGDGDKPEGADKAAPPTIPQDF